MDNLNHHPFCLLYYLPPPLLSLPRPKLGLGLRFLGSSHELELELGSLPKSLQKPLLLGPRHQTLSLSSSYYQQRGFSFLDPHGGWLEHGGVVYGVCDFLAMERKDTQCVILLLSLLSSSLIISGNSITIENDQQYITS